MSSSPVVIMNARVAISQRHCIRFHPYELSFREIVGLNSTKNVVDHFGILYKWVMSTAPYSERKDLKISWIIDWLEYVSKVYSNRKAITMINSVPPYDEHSSSKLNRNHHFEVTSQADSKVTSQHTWGRDWNIWFHFDRLLYRILFFLLSVQMNKSRQTKMMKGLVYESLLWIKSSCQIWSLQPLVFWSWGSMGTSSDNYLFYLNTPVEYYSTIL